MPPPFRCRKLRRVRRQLERCGECAPGRPCPNHQACASQHDAALASAIGAAWAGFVRGQLDIRRPWPPFVDGGRVAAIAVRLVESLAPEPRRSELARICHWRAGLCWEARELPRIRDRPYEAPDGRGVIPLPGALRIQFRTRRADRAGLPGRSTGGSGARRRSRP